MLRCTLGVRIGSWLCENVLADVLMFCHWSNESSRYVRSFSESWLAVTTPSSRHERLNAEDVHDAREIVGQYMQGHLGGHAR